MFLKFFRWLGLVERAKVEELLAVFHTVLADLDNLAVDLMKEVAAVDDQMKALDKHKQEMLDEANKAFKVTKNINELINK